MAEVSGSASGAELHGGLATGYGQKSEGVDSLWLVCELCP